MAKNVSIVIDDHNDGTTCTAQYNIRIRSTGTAAWTTLPAQFDSPLLITNLPDGSEWDYEITRTCCGGLTSAPASGTFTAS